MSAAALQYTIQPCHPLPGQAHPAPAASGLDSGGCLGGTPPALGLRGIVSISDGGLRRGKCWRKRRHLDPALALVFLPLATRTTTTGTRLLLRLDVDCLGLFARAAIAVAGAATRLLIGSVSFQFEARLPRRRTLGRVNRLGDGRLARNHIAIATELVLIVTVVTIELVVATRTLLLEARTVLVEDAIIMIGELQIIFGHHPIALRLGIARERLVFLMQLAGIAPRAIVDAITATAAGTIGTGAATATSTATTTTAVVLTIVNQRLNVLVLVVSLPLPMHATGISAAPKPKASLPSGKCLLHMS